MSSPLGIFFWDYLLHFKRSKAMPFVCALCIAVVLHYEHHHNLDWQGIYTLLVPSNGGCVGQVLICHHSSVEGNVMCINAHWRRVHDEGANDRSIWWVCIEADNLHSMTAYRSPIYVCTHMEMEKWRLWQSIALVRTYVNVTCFNHALDEARSISFKQLDYSLWWEPCTEWVSASDSS